jgi:hypothetical protein
MTHVPPRVKLPMNYTQHVGAPFCVSMMPDGLHLPDIEELSDAVNQFVRYCLPPLEGRTACITDVDGVLAIGYDYNPFAHESLRWFGIESAVSDLRNHPLVEPALMATIEMVLEPA